MGDEGTQSYASSQHLVGCEGALFVSTCCMLVGSMQKRNWTNCGRRTNNSDFLLDIGAWLGIM